MTLPPGQKALPGRPPRFGLDRFLRTVPSLEGYRLGVDGDVENPLSLDLDEVVGQDREERVSDLHCVTTWSAVGLAWSGRSFCSFWDRLVVPRARPAPGVAHARLWGLDGYVALLPLGDLLAPAAFLADRLDGAPLPIANGAPLRLVLPTHYGYKNVKHLSRIELTVEPRRDTGGRILVHPRGRVAREERSGLGGRRIWRWTYGALRPLFLARARRIAARAERRRTGDVPRRASGP